MAYQKVYMNQIHSSSLLCQLAQMWRSEVLCDAYIKTGSVVTKAHRVVLMAACPMLQSMDGATVGSQLEIKLAADILKDSVKTFLQYLYDGFMMLTEDNVKDVEKIARLLQVENVIKCCADFYKTLERVTGGSSYSSSQYKYSFQDQVEFKHVRATDIHRAMQNGSEKRPADAEEFRRKKTRGDSFSPSLSPRHTTDDSSFMLSSYTNSDAQRTSQNLGRVKPGFPASQTQGRHVVEDGFEMVQSDLDSNKSSREKGGTSTRPQQTVSVTVASQINPTPDVQIITIPDVSEADRSTGASGTSSSRQSIFSAAAASKSPNFSFGGNLSSPIRTNVPPVPSQSDRTSSTFTGPKGPRFTIGSSSRSETITSSSVYSSKESSSSSQSKSSTVTAASASDSKVIDIDTHPEQIIITPMAIDIPIVPTSSISEPIKPSFVSFIESESHGRISPTPEIEALSKQERTVSSAPVSVHEESNSSQPSSTPDLSIVKVETSPGPTTIQESDVPSLDMHVDVQPEDVEGIDDDGDDDGSDLEMYGYSDLSQGDSFGPGRSSDQSNSWYIQTLKEWLRRNGFSEDFERLDSELLDSILVQFYHSVYGEEGIRFIPGYLLKYYPQELTSYLRSAPFYRSINIINDPSFQNSRNALSVCNENRSESDELTIYPLPKRKRAMTQEDLNKLYQSGVLSNSNPISLQNKVWVEIMVYFGGLGRQHLRNLDKDNFILETDLESGKRYFRLFGPRLSRANTTNRMFEQPGNFNCPVESLLLYLSKLNPKTTVFFQAPLREAKYDDPIWYSHRPIGKNVHSIWLATICKEAGVTTDYSNSSLYMKTLASKTD